MVGFVYKEQGLRREQTPMCELPSADQERAHDEMCTSE